MTERDKGNDYNGRRDYTRTSKRGIYVINPPPPWRLRLTHGFTTAGGSDISVYFTSSSESAILNVAIRSYLKETRLVTLPSLWWLRFIFSWTARKEGRRRWCYLDWAVLLVLSIAVYLVFRWNCIAGSLSCSLASYGVLVFLHGKGNSSWVTKRRWRHYKKNTYLRHDGLGLTPSRPLETAYWRYRPKT